MVENIDLAQMKTSDTEKGAMSPWQAESTINAYIGEIYQTGSVDSERNVLLSLVEDMKSGKITPEQAATRAYNIKESRQNYH